MLCVFSNIIGGFILLHFNCDSEVPAEGTGYTSYLIIVSTMLSDWEPTVTTVTMVTTITKVTKVTMVNTVTMVTTLTTVTTVTMATMVTMVTLVTMLFNQDRPVWILG